MKTMTNCNRQNDDRLNPRNARELPRQSFVRLAQPDRASCDRRKRDQLDKSRRMENGTRNVNAEYRDRYRCESSICLFKFRTRKDGLSPIVERQ